VTAWIYNGTAPGPLIRVTEGDKVRIVFTHNLPKPTTIHWHGLPVLHQVDGVSLRTQEVILPSLHLRVRSQTRWDVHVPLAC
jgi:FtsP/CotA-like multicopper oxidase with cupredoxin domain